MRAGALSAVALFLIEQAALAQPTPVSQTEREYRWAITLAFTGALGGPTSDFEKSMRAAGYDQPGPSFFGPPASFPYSSAGIGSMEGILPSVTYAMSRHIAVGISGSTNKMGETTGYRAVSTNVEGSATHIGAVLFWRPTEAVRIGAGPAWYNLRLKELNSGQKSTAARLGFIAETGVSFPVRTRVYGDFQIQYRGTGRSDFGEITPRTFGSTSAPPIRFDGIRFDHWAFGAGVGVRL